MEALTHFSDTFNKYTSQKDKFDSLYIFVINKVENIYDSIF